MAGIYAFSILVLLICWQNQLCLSKDSIFNIFDLNTTPLEIANNIWSDVKYKHDLSKVETLNDIKLKDYINIPLNSYLEVHFVPFAFDTQNFTILTYMRELENLYKIIDNRFHETVNYFKDNAWDEDDIKFGNIILSLLSNTSSISIDRQIYAMYKRTLDEKESIINFVDRYLNKGFISNCLSNNFKQQSLQQFYRNFSTSIKLVEVKYLIEKKTLYDIVKKYPSGVVKAIEEPKFYGEDYTTYFGVEVINGTLRITACKLEPEDKYHDCAINITQSILKPAVSRGYESIKLLGMKVREAIKLKMKTASRDVWKCTQKLTEGVTYTKLDNLFQGYFISSPNTDKCSNTNVTEPCHFTRKCTGKIHNCKPINLTHNDDYLKICTTDKNNNYRYEYVEYGDPQDPKSYGEKKDCEFKINMKKPISYCICEESRPDSDRYVSLVPAMAKENQVVTGARLIKINHTLYIQIQEGELGAEATIKHNTASWTPVKTVEPTKENIDKKLTHEIQWNSGRGVYVTERSYTPLDVAVVGLGFGETPEKDLFLQVYGRSFDFATGKLLQDVIPFVFNVGREHTKILDLSNLDKPTRSNEINIAISTDQIIEFTTTSLDTDIGQHTIPFIDIQDVITDEITPMNDAEIYYKNVEGYGGYLGLKLHTYNIEPHFQIINIIEI